MSGSRTALKAKVAALVRRDGDACKECWGPMAFNGDGAGVNPLSASLDHVIPRCFLGSSHPVNLRLLHTVCNNERHAVFPEPVLARRIEDAYLAAPWVGAWRGLGWQPHVIAADEALCIRCGVYLNAAPGRAERFPAGVRVQAGASR